MGRVAVGDPARDSLAFRGAAGGRWGREPRREPCPAAYRHYGEVRALNHRVWR